MTKISSKTVKEHVQLRENLDNAKQLYFDAARQARRQLEKEHGTRFQIKNVSPSNVDKKKKEFCSTYGFPCIELKKRNGTVVIKSYVRFTYNEAEQLLTAEW